MKKLNNKNKKVMIIYVYDKKDKSPWIYGAYTDFSKGYEIQEKMQCSKKYGYLIWNNNIVSIN